MCWVAHRFECGHVGCQPTDELMRAEALYTQARGIARQSRRYDKPPESLTNWHGTCTITARYFLTARHRARYTRGQPEKRHGFYYSKRPLAEPRARP
jgi:hypothetical protein